MKALEGETMHGHRPLRHVSREERRAHRARLRAKAQDEGWRQQHLDWERRQEAWASDEELDDEESDVWEEEEAAAVPPPEPQPVPRLRQAAARHAERQNWRDGESHAACERERITRWDEMSGKTRDPEPTSVGETETRSEPDALGGGRLTSG